MTFLTPGLTTYRGESYYGFTTTCKRFRTNFLQNFDKVNLQNTGFGIPQSTKSSGLTGLT